MKCYVVMGYSGADYNDSVHLPLKVFSTKEDAESFVKNTETVEIQTDYAGEQCFIVDSAIECDFVEGKV